MDKDAVFRRYWKCFYILQTRLELLGCHSPDASRVRRETVFSLPEMRYSEHRKSVADTYGELAIDALVDASSHESSMSS